jgi:predicted deacylase
MAMSNFRRAFPGVGHPDGSDANQMAETRLPGVRDSSVDMVWVWHIFGRVPDIGIFPLVVELAHR